jgi:hypothetical protein
MPLMANPSVGESAASSTTEQSAASSTTEQSAASSANTELAVRSSEDEIRRLGQNLSVGECQRLANYFATKYSTKVVVQTPHAKLLMAKMAAASVFLEPAADWVRLMAAFSEKHGEPTGYICQCKCGCKCFSGHYEACRLCDKGVCGNCKSLGRYEFSHPVCHRCKKLPKREGFMVPPSVVEGLLWYFDHPQIANGRPDILCIPNRNTSFDPPLIEVIQLAKHMELVKDGRNVRPYNWESAFRVQLALADVDGAPVIVNMSYFYFIQNPAWARDPIVNFVEKWLRPETFSFYGIVRRNGVDILRPAEPQPQPKSPYGNPARAESDPESEEEKLTPEQAAKRTKEKNENEVDLKKLFRPNSARTIETPGVVIEEIQQEAIGDVETQVAKRCRIE